MKNLKKLLLVCFVMTLTTNYAQTNKYGIRAGVGIPNLKSTDDNPYSKDYETVPGFDGSFFADFGITENFSIKAELGFSRKGGERNGLQPIPPAALGPVANLLLPPGSEVWAEFDNKAVFSYIEIPILAKYEWNLGKTWGVYVNAGPYVDFIMSPEQVTSGISSYYTDETMTNEATMFYPIENVPPSGWPTGPIPPSASATTDINSDLSNMDFGAMFGIGVTAAISEKSEILFDMRGSYGFVPLQSDVDTYGTVHMGNLTFAIGYAYTLPSKVQATRVKE